MALTIKRVYVLVKAYPQASTRYQETVCCAGITEAGEFVRLYPIRYRSLPREAKFARYDVVEVRGEPPRNDYRPESFHVDETSIRIIRKAGGAKAETRAQLWLPHVSPSMEALRQANLERGVSLGIIRPDPGTVRFTWVPRGQEDPEDREIMQSVMHQTSLLSEEPLKPLTPPEYSFIYAFESGGIKSKCQIHDWEVQAAYLSYKARYADQALEKMQEAFQDGMQNLHLFLGTISRRPKQFIIVGVLRTSADLDLISRQPGLFA
jgi:hypothetical protein